MKKAATHLLIGGIVLFVLVFLVVFTQKRGTINPEKISLPINAQELLAASIQRTFQPTSFDDFRYQRIIHIRYHQLDNPTVQEWWSYKENYRKDYYFVPQFQSAMYTMKDNSECHSVSDFDPRAPEQYSVRAPAACAVPDAEQPLFDHFYEKVFQDVYDRIDRSADPLSQNEVTVEGEPAVRLLYRYKPSFATQSTTDETYFVEFLILTEQKKIVEMVGAASSGEFLFRITVTHDQSILDKDPEVFFTTASWMTEMTAVQTSLPALAADLLENAAQSASSTDSLIAAYVSAKSEQIAKDIVDAKALKEQQYGFVVLEEQQTRYTNDFYELSFVLPPADTWNATVNSADGVRGMFEHELIQLYHPDPSGNDISHFAQENVGKIDVSIVTPEREELYVQYMALLDAAEPRASDATYDLFGLKTEVTKEVPVTIDNKSGKQYFLETRTQTGEGDNTIEFLLALDDETILFVVGHYGLGENQDVMERDVLAVMDSLILK